MHIIQLLLLTAWIANAQQTQLPATQDSLREEVPIIVEYEKQVTPYIIVSVNKKKVKAVFDTGSSGLRILNGAIGDRRPDSTPARVRYTYGHGSDLFGVAGRLSSASIQVGRLTAPLPVNIMRIDSTRYGRGAGWTPTEDSGTIASGHFRDCPAIIGVGLRSRASLKGIVSPLAQLPGDGKFIVEFPAYGGTKGHLILNPLPEEEKGFILFHLKPGKDPLSQQFGSWLDNELSGCIIINGTAFCNSTMLDSGNPDSWVSTSEVTGNVPVPPGNIVMKISDTFDPLTMAVAHLDMIGKKDRSKSFVYLTAADKEGKNIFGVQTFFVFDVLYDLQNGYIGLKPK
jgi:hypothetical protein